MLHNKLLALHRELLYPAFLGAVLFEFARKIAEMLPDSRAAFWQGIFSNGFNLICIYSDQLIWFFTALWFLLYFSVAFLSLSGAERRQAELEAVAAQTGTQPQNEFCQVAFWANLAEIVLILFVGFGLSVVDRSKDPHQALYQVNYFVVFLGWLLIPVTAWISNEFSERSVRQLLSVMSIFFGFFGLLLQRLSMLNNVVYVWLLIMMYLLLIVYYIAIFKDRTLPFDIPPRRLRH